MRPTVRERIENRIKKDPSGCWLWTGCIIDGTNNGYGQVSVSGKMKLVHRAYWEIINGPIPEGLFVLHTCDNPPCINPGHLFLGAHTDNMQDMIKKGRKSKVVWNTNVMKCKHGHQFDEKNTRITIEKGKTRRACRTCVNINSYRYRAKRKTNG